MNSLIVTGVRPIHAHENYRSGLIHKIHIGAFYIFCQNGIELLTDRLR